LRQIIIKPQLPKLLFKSELGRVWVSSSVDAFSLEASSRLRQIIAEFPPSKSPLTIGLSGGATPRQIYSYLGQFLMRESATGPIETFQTDERNVAADHPDSNQKMIRESLLAGGHFDRMRFYPIEVIKDKPLETAASYEALLNEKFSREDRPSGRMDLQILGLGEDGHFASLFPETDWREPEIDNPAREFEGKYFKAVWVESLRTFRFTMTFQFLARSKTAVFLIAGKKKAAILKHIFSRKNNHLPAAAFAAKHPCDWLLDPESVALLVEK